MWCSTPCPPTNVRTKATFPRHELSDWLREGWEKLDNGGTVGWGDEVRGNSERMPGGGLRWEQRLLRWSVSIPGCPVPLLSCIHHTWTREEKNEGQNRFSSAFGDGSSFWFGNGDEGRKAGWLSVTSSSERLPAGSSSGSSMIPDVGRMFWRRLNVFVLVLKLTILFVRPDIFWGVQTVLSHTRPPDGNVLVNRFVRSPEIISRSPEISWFGGLGGHSQYQNCKNQSAYQISPRSIQSCGLAGSYEAGTLWVYCYRKQPFSTAAWKTVLEKGTELKRLLPEPA